MRQPALFALVLLSNLFAGMISVRDISAPFAPPLRKEPVDWSEPAPATRQLRYVPMTAYVPPAAAARRAR